jgi:hypothetical protein
MSGDETEAMEMKQIPAWLKTWEELIWDFALRND